MAPPVSQAIQPTKKPGYGSKGAGNQRVCAAGFRRHGDKFDYYEQCEQLEQSTTDPQGHIGDGFGYRCRDFARRTHDTEADDTADTGCDCKPFS